MGKKQDDPRGKQKGPQQHAEGEHGEKAHARLREEIQSEGRPEREDVEQRDLRAAGEHPADGGHRLFEGREQHDPADEGSERNRKDIDVERHGHDPAAFEPRGGKPGR
jgi:hypothetical protein